MDASLFRQGMVDGKEMALTVTVVHGSGRNATKTTEFNFFSKEPKIGKSTSIR